MAGQAVVRNTFLCLALLGASIAAVAPASAQARHPANPQDRLKGVDARLAAARAHNQTLQAQVTQMERQGAAQQKQLRQRDAEIAALQQKLRAAGVPASATSAVH